MASAITSACSTLSLETCFALISTTGGLSSNADIGSTWGDPRDAGARKHEGIDIFAKRGTPALAAEDGRIVSVREGGLGGKTVWMRPTGKNISLYYAHLDSQLVSIGQRVKQGDTVGLIGNTGNARFTPAHLHFGIYGIEGALDPLPYVKKEHSTPPAIKGKETLIGKIIRTSLEQKLYLSEKGATVLDANTYARIVAVTGTYYKILLPDGTQGFFPVHSAVPLARTVEKIFVRKAILLTAEPKPNSAVVHYVQPSVISVKAYYKNYAFIETDSLDGWLSLADLTSP